ncbi:MAG: hypothetical protein AB1531_10260 [Chloroflexota bacterium]
MMPSNHLEQLIAEWYEYQGYFVRRNIFVGKRAKGGYECELDVVAFHPLKKHLVHIEPSLDADSWSIRETRFRRKFDAGRKYILGLFNGVDIPLRIDQFAVFVFASTTTHKEIGGGKIIIVDDLLKEIFHELRDKHLASSAIPEHLVILRSFQFVTEYREAILNIWSIHE